MRIVQATASDALRARRLGRRPPARRSYRPRPPKIRRAGRGFADWRSRAPGTGRTVPKPPRSQPHTSIATVSDERSRGGDRRASIVRPRQLANGGARIGAARGTESRAPGRPRIAATSRVAVYGY